MFEEIWIIYVTVIHKSKSEWTRTLFPNFFGTRELFRGRQYFHRLEPREAWFQDDSSTLHLLCTLFLLL